MKVLVVSHNVFCPTSSMGKTLKSYFQGWEAQEIAQLFIHGELPTDPICVNYYRMTDKEILKSILTRKSGRVYGKEDIKDSPREETAAHGTTQRLYQKGRKRTPAIYMARNLWWTLGAWKTKKLLRWVDDFSPDVVFFASGDYAFMYKIALALAKYKKIPLIVSCMDDYYFYNKNEGKFAGKFVHRQFMKQVNKVMDYADCVFTICEKMTKDYAARFQKPCYTLATPTSLQEPLHYEKTNAISYAGNLGYRRNEQLISIGRALKKLNCPGKPEYIDVYSTENRPEILKDLTEENGIRFHGSVSGEEVLQIMGKSLAVIHTESFGELQRKSVAYSVSTKIADALASGTCIFAYGPGEIASIKYLAEETAALCVTDPEELERGLEKLLTDPQLRSSTIQNALALAERNHNSQRNCGMIKTVLERACGK